MTVAHARGFDEVQCLERFDGPPDLEGLVFEQQPAAGIILTEPRLLKVYVFKTRITDATAGTSDGPAPTEARVAVPAVSGKALAEAVEIIQGAQLTVEAEGPSLAPELHVVAQTPLPDQMVPRGSLVRLSVRIQVPDFGDLSCGQAHELGRKRGLPELKCQMGMPPGDRHLTGLVFEQSVRAGELLEAPELVLVTVAALTVPDVEGRTVVDAQHALESLKLKAVLDVADAKSRVVNDQAPAPGTLVNIGDAVRLTTSQLVAVPDLDGQSCADAQDATNRVQLKLECLDGGRRGYSLLSPIVMRQRPKAKDLVRVGTVVMAQASAPTPWDAIGLAALLTAGAAAAMMVRRPFRFRPHPRQPPRVRTHVRGEPDRTPILAIRMENSSGPGLPRITVRGERGSAQLVIRGLDDGHPRNQP
jgi:beta-lactam-binding protein with PASTA domain